ARPRLAVDRRSARRTSREVGDHLAVLRLLAGQHHRRPLRETARVDVGTTGPPLRTPPAAHAPEPSPEATARPDPRAPFEAGFVLAAFLASFFSLACFSFSPL